MKIENLARITNDETAISIENDISEYKSFESLPYSKNVTLSEICKNVIPDKQGVWLNPVFFVKTSFESTISSQDLMRLVKEYLDSRDYNMDILSIMARNEGESIMCLFFVRIYGIPPAQWPYFDDIYDFIFINDKGTMNVGDSRFIYPDGSYSSHTDEERENHMKMVWYQKRVYESATEEKPFLNSIDRYVPSVLYDLDPNVAPIYDLMTKEKMTPTKTPYYEYREVFCKCMEYVSSVERDIYKNVLRGKHSKDEFMSMLEAYIERNFIESGRLRQEDEYVLLAKLDKALFQMYLIRDLIDDEEITDIKITAPDSIRVRIKGKAYLSNITFVDDEDYFRFIESVAIRKGIDMSLPVQTFTDDSDENYILRFSITSGYISSGYPIMHVRKVPRKKLMAPDLIRLGFFDEKIRDYLIDCGKYSRGVVFAGTPGSGKTTALNWFLEDAYEDSAEILVIQENDELFCYRKGVMIEHVVNNPRDNERRCTLEDLGQMALVSGANVFVIGEAKGAEICSAITLSNSGCRTAITIHSPSATDTIDKMADLAMRGYADSYEQAVRMMKSFQTIVYINDFKVQEITEITGFDEVNKKIKYRYIYKRQN